jgi:hypothetical protein
MLRFHETVRSNFFPKIVRMVKQWSSGLRGRRVLYGFSNIWGESFTQPSLG